MATQTTISTLTQEEQNDAEAIYRLVIEYFSNKGFADTQKIFNRVLTCFAASNELQHYIGEHPGRDDREAAIGVVSDALYLITDSFNYIPKEQQIQCL